MTQEKNNFQFENPTKKGMTFQEVFKNIQKFMEYEPRSRYTIMIGTDSQSFSNHTRFITGIILRREGNGTWSCMRKVNYPQKIVDLHEKISKETSFTEEIAVLLTDELKDVLTTIIRPHLANGAELIIEGNMDIGFGKQNKTRFFVEEMMKRIELSGLEPKIKPYSMAATCYANKYTK